ncbi:uncharacterized protein LOC132271589 [Cornus florida]|uniref:uncharacterized protein LOC132271589 n=1 Tax=Cornus florida TaxID=4283 RepID=UPI00289FDBA6|nr:uncharacterized protein LOC132271589 [Cornus florida]
MALRIKATLLVLLLLTCISSGIVEGFSDRVKPTHSLLKDGGVQMNSRKLLNSMLDYDYAGANSKHDPKKGKPGGGNGKSP